MLARALRITSRGFKSWVEYKAEQAEVSVPEYLELTQKPQGAYVKWRNQVANEARVNYALDHCSEEEAKKYLAEFSTEDLAEYILDHINDMPEETVMQLSKLNVQFHRFPGLDFLASVRGKLSLTANLTFGEFTERGALNRIAEVRVNQKLDELVWRKMDADAVEKYKSKSEVAKQD
jgi:hypothetical protein